MIDTQLSTGLVGLDRVFRGLIPGDNLVWNIAEIADYAPLVAAYCRFARDRGRRLVYFRFADHPPLTSEAEGARVVPLRVGDGFEQFITAIHRVVSESGRGAYFVFDCLSSLAVDWCSDRMLGNFFMLTCPYVLDQESLAYFALIRGWHSVHATAPIVDTTQIFVDVYRHSGRMYIAPIKVQHRYSPTMHMLHAWQGDDFRPVSESATIAEIQSSRAWTAGRSVGARLGVWDRRFLQAEELAEAQRRGTAAAEVGRDVLAGLLRMVVSRESRVLELAETYFALDDMLDIWRRMIGTGLIGGKATGMLLARAILRRDPRWRGLLEAHDSFFIGSDVFYTYLVQNGCWWLRQKQRDPGNFLDGLEEVRRRILMGRFPDDIRHELGEMLDYFGQSPIIVRSSSLLEDNFGNAFAGKYESVFCANQGPHQKRLEDFMSAVRTVYASAMSEKALRYRAARGMLDRDEQMSLLVQRVSGMRYGSRFFPQVAGVGLSFNPYVWSHYIDPEAGLLRLVFGLGTRAVDRTDDDYTRVVALNAPERRPETDSDEVRQYSQRKVDVIDLEGNHVTTADFEEVAAESPQLPLDVYCSTEPLRPELAERGLKPRRLLTFEPLLSRTPFVEDMRAMLQTLEDAYQYPVDTEFTANFFAADRFKINIVQCRPLQTSGSGVATDLPTLAAADVVLAAQGAVIGRSRCESVEQIVYVVPALYGQLPLGERYAVARLIGKALHAEAARGRWTLLVGPGRWGTTTPSLGVPVTFAEIDTIAAVCEIVAMRDDLVPDVSLGTHFFNELVELDILYMALFPGREGNGWQEAWFERQPNRLLQLVPQAAAWQDVVRVIDAGDTGLLLNANALAQRVVCYREPPAVAAGD